MDAATVGRLNGPEGAEIFAHLGADFDSDSALRANTALRAAGYPADLVAAALTQWELRHRARSKFGPDAGHMFFTRDGLEQSTRETVADLHADRFVNAGVQHVWDMGCGIGGDALGFRRRGLDVTAIEADPLTAAVAQFNLASRFQAGAGSVTVRNARVEEVLAELNRPHSGSATAPATDQGVWLDPARRSPGVGDARGRTRRVRSARDMAPPWDVVLEAARSVPVAGVKVGASFNVAHLDTGVQAQWISVDNQAVECVLWWGLAATSPSTRSASLHLRGRWHHLATDDPPVNETLSVGYPHLREVTAGAYVGEVDPAVSAAGMRSQVCAQLEASELGLVDYLLSPRPVTAPWVRCWQIVEVLPVSAKALRAWARRNDIGAVTVKKPPSRSASPLARFDPEALRSKIGARGSVSATLLLTEIDGTGTTVALWLAPVG